MPNETSHLDSVYSTTLRSLRCYLQQEYGLEKIVILDWDVHHGNGTQHSFESDPSIFYISLHQYPHYPGTGAYSETGIGDGSGTTLNCPMPAGSDDSHYETSLPRKNTAGCQRLWTRRDPDFSRI